MLNTYLQQTQRFLRDQNQQLINPADMISYINRARRELAMRTQCLRALTPISGGISTINVTDGGSGYSATPTITISDPDFPSGAPPYPGGLQATAEATVAGGVITDILVTNGGSGYFQPTITITDTTGSGATAEIEGTIGFQTIANQEVYSFSGVDLSGFPGYDSVFAVTTVTILFNNWRYALPVYGFNTYQAIIRQYPRQYYYVPAVCAQFGQGTAGSLYLYPIASQPYQCEWTCVCLPSDLEDDNSVEAIPMPWRDCVPYMAASLCFAELQNLNASKYYMDQYDNFVHRYSGYARPGMTQNPYGRAWR